MQKDIRREALDLAHTVLERAYVPYSGFRMGAAVATESGRLFPGALVENVSLGLAMCAERIALFSTVAHAAGRPTLLVLVSKRTDGKLTFPCGACLQVALELGGPELEVVASDLEETIETAVLRQLAPRFPLKT
jgi:cytidine deaminase